jgi:hypothetical protein
MRLIGAVFFALGILMAVRVMFFGVRLQATGDHVRLRASRLAVAAILLAFGAMAYARSRLGGDVTAGWVSSVVVVGALAGAVAWWVVRASARAGTDDPEHDPRYRFQGFVARVVASIPGNHGTGRVALVVDGQPLEMAARWLPNQSVAPEEGAVDREVVIEHVDGDVAYVEPWAVVESRL